MYIQTNQVFYYIIQHLLSVYYGLVTMQDARAVVLKWGQFGPQGTFDNVCRLFRLAWLGKRDHLVFIGWTRLEMLLNILQWTRQLPQWRIIQSKMPIGWETLYEVEKPCMKDKKSNKRQYLPSKRLLSSEGVEGRSRARGVRAAEKGGDA